MEGAAQPTPDGERFVYLPCHSVARSRHSRIPQLDNTSAVPTELLCEILRLAKDAWPCPSGPPHQTAHRQNAALLRMTSVCSRWRSVSIASGTLWSNIAFVTSQLSTVECAELFLARSKGSMLSVYISDHGKSFTVSQYVEDVIRKVVNASERIKICELSSYSAAFWSRWIQPTPNIRRLVVGGRNMANVGRFGAELAGLRNVTSFSCGLWPLGESRCLTSVEIRNDDQPVSLSTFLDALRGCETLESLVLHGFNTFLVSDTPPAVVSLPNLRRLNLFSCDSTVLLARIVLSGLSEPLMIFNPNPHEDILRSLPKCHHHAKFLRNLGKLQVVLNARRSQYSVAAYRADGRLALYIGASDVAHWLRWGWVTASLDAVACFPPFSTVDSLSFATDSLLTSWDLWLPHLRHLRYLNVTCPGPDKLLCALLTPDANTGLPMCRALRSLALHRCEHRTLINYAHLKRLVLWRWATQSPLEEIILHEDEWAYMRYLDMSWVDLVGSQSTFLSSEVSAHC